MSLPRRHFLALGTGAAVVAATAGPAFATLDRQTANRYRWRNVEIVGGGFVTGVIHHPTRRGLVYARTDIGGAARLDVRTRRWVQLLEWIGWEEWNWTGVESLALDPSDPDRLYLAVGTYTNEWSPINGAILRSTDQGRTFRRTDLPFKLGGNEPGRSMGERLAVDPRDGRVLYLGTRNQGLWRSTDRGETWDRVESFPVGGTPGLGVGFVFFDPRGARRGRPTPTIYAGVTDPANPLYRSTDGGQTWAPVPGQPTELLPHHGELAPDGHVYVTYGDRPGPYEMYDGAVHKVDTATGEWTDITPLRPNTGGEAGFGYAGLAVDPRRPGTVMVATMSRWGPVDDIFRSVDGGASWHSIAERIVLDTSGAPYLNFHGTPKLGWMIGDISTGAGKLETVLDRAGHCWLAAGAGGLYRSADRGTTYAPVKSVAEAYTVGFGQAGPGRPEMAVYTSGKVAGVRGIFRSDDSGRSWVRVNDDRHQYASTGEAIAGDPRVYGRVYVSTNGLGIPYGEPV